MISHKKKFIFIHIPKTGGTSVSDTLTKHAITLQGKRNFESVYFKHAYAQDIKRMLGDTFEEYFRFTIVRHPLDWIVSNYAFNRGLHRPFVRNTEYEVSRGVPDWGKDTPFHEWLPWWIETFKPSQHAMLLDENGELLTQEIYQFEQLKENYRSICRKVGVRPKRLGHANASARKRDLSQYYTPEMLSLVEQHFAQDFSLLGYKVEDAL